MPKKKRRHARRDDDSAKGSATTRPRSPARLTPGPAGSAMDVAGLMTLQRKVGNRAVQRALIQQNAERAQGSKARAGAHEGESETEQVQREVQAPDTQLNPVLSGTHWVDKFPAHDELSRLHSSFGAGVGRFVGALRDAGATVDVLDTERTKERVFLMHWAWRIAKGQAHPLLVPGLARLDIQWWHGSLEESEAAAQEMVDAYGLGDMETAPPLKTLHLTGQAVDMEIAWTGELSVKDAGGQEHLITTDPYDGTNPDLMRVARTYGVIHATEVDERPLHWSVDGT